ncbi:MAG: M56 family metallopeptidase, partial [Acetatifactor sp.]|nr:M56 family metallopeptidase [Acetatifactor sp.]
AREKHIESGRGSGDKGDIEKGGILVGRGEQTAGNGSVEMQKGQSAALAGDTSSQQLSMWSIIVGIWITGSILLMGYGLFSYFRLKRKLCCSLRLEGWGEGIYLADGIETPFVLGFIAPRIYLPSSMADKNYPYVIAHERTHIRRRDYWIKLGACLLTCLYWFHPLVWAGFILMNRDMEMSCDEAVLRRMDGDCRGEYADCLLQLTCGRHYPAAAPLAFGEGDTRGRIRHIMGYRKAAAAMAIVAVVLTGILAAVLLVSPRKVAAGDDHASVGNGGQKFSFQVAYRDIVSCPLPVMTGNTSLGADGAILDYADEDKVIFHGNFGLYIYSSSAGETIGAVDLRALGCGDTRGDNTCQVLVSRDGSKVYFYPLDGIDEVQSSDQGHAIYSYVYDVPSGRLRIMSWNLGQSGDSCEEIDFSRLMGEELAQGRAVPVAELEPDVWEQGFCSYHGMVFERDGEQVFGYLKSASETLEDLVYVQGPVYAENPANVQEPGEEEKPDAVTGGGDWREAVRLFGANGQGTSTVSYDRRETTPWINIDVITYDLGQALTQ